MKNHMINNKLSKLLEFKSKLFKFLKTVRTDSSLHSLKTSDILLFCHDVNRGIKLSNTPYSPLIDSLKDEFEKEGWICTTIASPWSKLVGSKAYGNPISINRDFLYAKVTNFFLKKASFIKTYNSEVKLYERIIEKSNAKLIVSMNSSNALCEAARNKKIYHAELLHGIGYTPIPWGWDLKEKKHLPQCILSLDEVSTKTFSVLRKHKIDVLGIPHPFFKRFDKSVTDKLPQEWQKHRIDNKYDKEILVSLQWGYSPGVDEKDIFKGTLENGLYYQFLENVIKETQHSVYWRFRLHPVQYTQPEKYHRQVRILNELTSKYDNTEWKQSTELPLPSLLSTISGHLTMCSMASYEAAYLGIPTLALEPLLRADTIYSDMFEDLVSKGYLIKRKASEKQILDWVASVEKKNPLLSNIYDNNSVISWLADKSNLKIRNHK